MNHDKIILISGRFPGLPVALSLLAVAAGWVPAAAQEDSLSGQIVRMLEAELSEEIIREWLDGQSVPTEPLSADDLVALKSAGASDDLLRALIVSTRGAPETVSPPTSAPATERPSAPPTPAPPGLSSSSPAPTSESLVTFKLSYLARFEEPDPEWDLFVYIDGIPLSYLTTASIEKRAAEIEFLRSVPAGEHVLRVTQERHFKRGGQWRHETRVATTAFPFELAGGVPVRLELEFVERLMDYQDPLAFKLTQGAAVTDSGRVGGEAEFWPFLCDDIEASIATGKKPSRRQGRKLEECVRWEGLWGSLVAPSRSEVLDAMADFEFRPRPKGV